MKFSMMVTAQGYSKFITDFSSERSWLGKFEMMCVAGRALADKTRLARDIGKVSSVPPVNVLAYWFDQLRFRFRSFKAFGF